MVARTDGSQDRWDCNNCGGGRRACSKVRSTVFLSHPFTTTSTHQALKLPAMSSFSSCVHFSGGLHFLPVRLYHILARGVIVSARLGNRQVFLRRYSSSVLHMQQQLHNHIATLMFQCRSLIASVHYSCACLCFADRENAVFGVQFEVSSSQKGFVDKTCFQAARLHTCNDMQTQCPTCLFCKRTGIPGQRPHAHLHPCCTTPHKGTLLSLCIAPVHLPLRTQRKEHTSPCSTHHS